MKFNHVRRLSHSLVVLGCIATVSASTVIAAGPQSTSWVKISPTTSPQPRSYLAMTYDAASGRVIIFGGFDGTTYLNDTWTFDGATWARVNAHPSPPARTNAQIAYDAITQKVVLFGGFNGKDDLVKRGTAGVRTAR